MRMLAMIATLTLLFAAVPAATAEEPILDALVQMSEEAGDNLVFLEEEALFSPEDKALGAFSLWWDGELRGTLSRAGVVEDSLSWWLTDGGGIEFVIGEDPPVNGSIAMEAGEMQVAIPGMRLFLTRSGEYGQQKCVCMHHTKRLGCTDANCDSSVECPQQVGNICHWRSTGDGVCPGNIDPQGSIPGSGFAPLVLGMAGMKYHFARRQRVA